MCIQGQISVILLLILSLWTSYSMCMTKMQSKRIAFPVESCPVNISEVEYATERLNCSSFDKFENTYHCLPLSDLSQLVELCYFTSFLIEKGNCMVLQSGYLNNRSCLHFPEGCPKKPYQSKLMMEYPVCTKINKQKRCYKADPACSNLTSDYNTRTFPTTTNTTKLSSTKTGDTSVDKNRIAILTGVIGVLVFIFICSGFTWRRFSEDKRFRKNKNPETEGLLQEGVNKQLRERDIVSQHAKSEVSTRNASPSEEDVASQHAKSEFSTQQSHLLNVKESTSVEGKTLKDEILENWMDEDIDFVPTKASAVVEQMLTHQNLVVVAGNSGSGKSAIIQHTALKYKKQGWNVIPVVEVKDIIKICSPGISEKIIFVLNDPLGQESLDALLYNSWKLHKNTLEICLKKVRLLMSCRRWILNEKNVKGKLLDESSIVEIDNEENKLTNLEKNAILNQYKKSVNLSEDLVSEIIKTDAYFPLLCKLFFRESIYEKTGADFFKCPHKFIRNEIEMWKESDEKKFCALILIVSFQNNLNINAIKGNKSSFNKYKEILKMCALHENTLLSVIQSSLLQLKGSYVKCVGNVFQFLHHYILEITTLVFGVDYPQEIVKYADSGFLRRRMKIEDDTEEEDRDPFTVYLPEEYIGDLVDRFIIDMQTENLIDVLLNPCVRNESVIKSFKEKVDSSEKILLRIKCEIDRSEFSSSFEGSGLSRLGFLDWKEEICPLIGFIIFCHDDISSFFLNKIDQRTLKDYTIFSAVCANGKSDLLNSLSEEYKKSASASMVTWNVFSPIHIASVFHNFSIIEELVRLGADVNKFTTDDMWTPLSLAAANDEYHVNEAGMDTKTGERRNKTIICLSNNIADINLCHKNGVSPLWIACQNGHDNTVQLLLKNGADINLCNNDGVSPFYVACLKGHESTVQLLLDNGADINLNHNVGASPLWIACQNGHDRIVKFLLSKNIEINLCDKNGVSPLYIACGNGHESTVQLLLNNGADINLNKKNGRSPLWIACQNGLDSIAKLLLSKNIEINLCDEDGVSPLHKAANNGHDSTVLLLLDNGADINLCENNRISPLYLGCYNGHENTVQLLLDNGADINLYNNDGISPLYVACRNGHESMVQLLLDNGADINLNLNDGTSPLWIACQNGHDSIVKLLLSENIEINSCNKNGVSPFYTACANGHESTVQLLLNNGADINLNHNDVVSPLWIACHNGFDSIVKLLLSKNIDINSCNKIGVSPLYIACVDGHESTVRILLNSHADINLCDNDGDSPLYIACYYGHDTTVQLLLNNGADINICNKKGESPLLIAKKNGHDITVQLLIDNGAS